MRTAVPQKGRGKEVGGVEEEGEEVYHQKKRMAGGRGALLDWYIAILPQTHQNNGR